MVVSRKKKINPLQPLSRLLFCFFRVFLLRSRIKRLDFVFFLFYIQREEERIQAASEVDDFLWFLRRPRVFGTLARGSTAAGLVAMTAALTSA